MKIENQLKKEQEIFSKIGDLCSLEEYVNEFKTTYPNDILALYELFAEQGKNVRKCVRKYLHESFYKGRLRYRILMGINRIPVEKSKENKRKGK